MARYASLCLIMGPFKGKCLFLPDYGPNPNPNPDSDRLIGQSRLSFCIHRLLWGSTVGHPSNSWYSWYPRDDRWAWESFDVHLAYTYVPLSKTPWNSATNFAEVWNSEGVIGDESKKDVSRTIGKAKVYCCGVQLFFRHWLSCCT